MMNDSEQDRIDRHETALQALQVIHEATDEDVRVLLLGYVVTGDEQMLRMLAGR